MKEFHPIEVDYINAQDPNALPPLLYKDDKIKVYRLGFGDWKIDDQEGSHYFSFYPEDIPGLEFKPVLGEKGNHQEFVKKSIEEISTLVYHQPDLGKIVFDF